jgi:hypothetical protein
LESGVCRRRIEWPERVHATGLLHRGEQCDTDLEIQEGGQASLEYLRVHVGDVPEDERRKVREQLERYCGQNTVGMIWIRGRSTKARWLISVPQGYRQKSRRAEYKGT